MIDTLGDFEVTIALDTIVTLAGVWVCNGMAWDGIGSIVSTHIA